MELLYDLFLGLALAMDAAAVSMAGGANIASSKEGNGSILRAALLAALFFGVFQTAMLAIGWFGGDNLKSMIADVDHWVAFILLAGVGGKMIYESLGKHEGKKTDLLAPKALFVLAIATSIDALVVGAGLAFVNGGIVLTAVIVGAVTAALSFVSVFIGARYGEIFENKVELLGGVVLVLIGLRILLGHLGFI